MRNTPCEAFEWLYSYSRCGACGLPYWVHSHEYALDRATTGWPAGRIKHRLITQAQAAGRYANRGDDYANSGGSAPDYRPRYQIMQERYVSISRFYLTKAQLIRHRAQDGARRELQRTWS